jgi:hypothetical protein
LSFLLPLLETTKNLDDYSVFQSLFGSSVQEIATDKVIEYAHKLFSKENAMIFHVLFKIQTSVAEGLSIVISVKAI